MQHLFYVGTVQYSKILIITCNIPEVYGDVVGGSSVGQNGVGGHVHTSGHDGSVVMVTSGHWVLPSVVLVVSEISVVSSVGQVHGNIVVSGHSVISCVGVVVSVVYVVSSVGHVHGNVVSVVPAVETIFRNSGLLAVFNKVYDCCRCRCLTFLNGSLQQIWSSKKPSGNAFYMDQHFALTRRLMKVF